MANPRGAGVWMLHLNRGGHVEVGKGVYIYCVYMPT